MTESQWLAPNVLVISLVAHLKERVANRRKMRLFIAECARLLIPHVGDARSLRAIDFIQANAEREHRGLRGRGAIFADAGVASQAALAHARATDDSGEYARRKVAETATFAAAMAVHSDVFTAAYFCAEHTAHALSSAAIVASVARDQATLAAVSKAERSVQHAVQVQWLRDIFGNPFRLVAFDAVWRTDTAMSLAKGMYESRDFGAMPILADALQDAGCDNDDVLNHCRDANGVHVRGCWVVDLVLGRV